MLARRRRPRGRRRRCRARRPPRRRSPRPGSMWGSPCCRSAIGVDVEVDGAGNVRLPELRARVALEGRQVPRRVDDPQRPGRPAARRATPCVTTGPKLVSVMRDSSRSARPSDYDTAGAALRSRATVPPSSRPPARSSRPPNIRRPSSNASARTSAAPSPSGVSRRHARTSSSDRKKLRRVQRKPESRSPPHRPRSTHARTAGRRPPGARHRIDVEDERLAAPVASRPDRHRAPEHRRHAERVDRAARVARPRPPGRITSKSFGSAVNGYASRTRSPSSSIRSAASSAAARVRTPSGGAPAAPRQRPRGPPVPPRSTNSRQIARSSGSSRCARRAAHSAARSGVSISAAVRISTVTPPSFARRPAARASRPTSAPAPTHATRPRSASPRRAAPSRA